MRHSARVSGRVLKEGLLEDHANYETLVELLSCLLPRPLVARKQDVSLESYVSRVKRGQDKIYYIVADNYAAAKDQSSPGDL